MIKVKDMTTSKFLVVIPAKNEALTIANVLVELKQCFPFDVVVIDDGSTDDTALIAREHGAVVLPHIRSLGAWKATQTGMRYAYA